MKLGSVSLQLLSDGLEILNECAFFLIRQLEIEMVVIVIDDFL
jgi:hypothetical protein